MNDLKRYFMAVVTIIFSIVGSLFIPWIIIAVSPALIIICGAMMLTANVFEIPLRDGALTRAKSVVIVDDDAVALLFIKSAFQAMGFKVKAFLCPLTALAEIGNQRFDFAIVDNMMPGLSGEEFLMRLDRQWHVTNQNQKPSAIMYTGCPEDIHLKASELQSINYRGILNKKNFNTRRLLQSLCESLGIAT